MLYGKEYRNRSTGESKLLHSIKFKRFCNILIVFVNFGFSLK